MVACDHAVRATCHTGSVGECEHSAFALEQPIHLQAEASVSWKWAFQKGGMEMLQKKWTSQVGSVVAIFGALALIFALLLILARFVLMADPFAQTALISVGSALLGGGVAFFLIEIYSLWQERKSQTTEFKTSREREPVLK